MKRLVALCAVLIHWGAVPASAQTFDELAAAAHPIEARELGGLVWAATGACEARGDDLLRRQCRGVLAARAHAARGATFRMRLPAEAISATGLRGCLACAEPVDGKLRVVTRGGVRVDAGTLVGPDLWQGAIPEGRDPSHLVGEVVFRLQVEKWTQAGLAGVSVEALGWRLADPCDGTVIAASPPSASAPVDRAACGDAPAIVEKAVADEKPATLSASQIHETMRSVSKDVTVCFESFGVPGTADVFLDIAGDGRVRFAEVRGELADTPTSRCIVDAVKKAKFPPFHRSGMQINYPFILR